MILAQRMKVYTPFPEKSLSTDFKQDKMIFGAAHHVKTLKQQTANTFSSMSLSIPLTISMKNLISCIFSKKKKKNKKQSNLKFSAF